MKINVQSVNFNADQKLITFIEGRLNKLEKYFGKIINANVYLKVQKTSEPENKITEILLSVPGDEIIVKKITKKFEEGVDEGVSAMKRCLKKKKEKLKTYA